MNKLETILEIIYILVPQNVLQVQVLQELDNFDGDFLVMKVDSLTCWFQGSYL